MAAGSIGRCHRHSILSTDVYARISHMCENHEASPTSHTNHQPKMKSSRRSLGSDKTQVCSHTPFLVHKAHNTEMLNLSGSAGRFHHSGRVWSHPMLNVWKTLLKWFHYSKNSYNMRKKYLKITVYWTVNESQSSPPCVSCRLAHLQPGHPHVFCERFQAWPSVHRITIPWSCHGHHPSMASQVSSQQEQHSISILAKFYLSFWMIHEPILATSGFSAKTTINLKSN